MYTKIAGLALGLSFVLAFPGLKPTTWGQALETDQEEQLRPTTGQPAGPQSLDLQRIAGLIIEKTNHMRRRQERQPVEPNENLMETTHDFANYMARTDRYGHTADGQRPSQRAKAHRYEYCVIEENIAYVYRSTGFTEKQLAEKFVQGWVDSPEHRENMLDQAVTETGVAVAHSDQSGVYYAVQMFGRPRSASIQFSIANNTGETIQYRIADRKLTLPPRYTRTHRQCRLSDLTFPFSDEASAMDEEKKTFEPESGDQFVVVQEQGKLQVRQQESEAPQK